MSDSYFGENRPLARPAFLQGYRWGISHEEAAVKQQSSGIPRAAAASEAGADTHFREDFTAVTLQRSAAEPSNAVTPPR